MAEQVLLNIPLERLSLLMRTARERERGAAPAGAQRVPMPRERLLRELRALEPPQRVELLALAWMGRGDFEPHEFPRARAQAEQLISLHPTEYLADLPGLADYLASALTSLGFRLDRANPQAGLRAPRPARQWAN